MQAVRDRIADELASKRDHASPNGTALVAAGLDEEMLSEDSLGEID